jgi:hypothetical protein
MNLLRSDTDVHIQKSVAANERLAAEPAQCDHDAPRMSGRAPQTSRSSMLLVWPTEPRSRMRRSIPMAFATCWWETDLSFATAHCRTEWRRGRRFGRTDFVGELTAD